MSRGIYPKKKSYIFYSLFSLIAVLAIAVFVQAERTGITEPTESKASSTTVTLTSIADTYVDGNNSGTNYGGLSRMEVDGSPVKIAYIKFDISSLAGKNITSAKLRIRGNADTSAGSNGTQNVKVTSTTSWSESLMTYSNRPTSSSAIATISGFAPSTWSSAIVTGAVQSKIGQSTISFTIDSGSGDNIIFYSRQADSDPQLVVTYDSSTSTVVPTTYTGTNIPTPKATPTTTTSSGCDTSLWQHIDSSERHTILKSCVTVSGVVIANSHASNGVWLVGDGDAHINIRLDSGEGSKINYSGSTLITEIICHHIPWTDSVYDRVIKACSGYTNKIATPKLGQHVRVTGVNIKDGHGNIEIHPVSKIEVL